MAIYRGSGGAGDATGDATNASVLAVAAAAEAQASATSAASSATNAASSASAASTSETDAGNSATAAATSATDAAASASTASTQATNAASSATAAASSASAASSSASSASSSASAASTSATNAASSASSASTSASNAATSETNAASSASSAASSAASAAAALDSFDDRYLGSKTSDPTLDNDGNALVTGALYYNSVDGEMRVYDGSQWIAASAASQAILTKYKYVATAGQTTFTGSDANALTLSYTVGSIIVTLNGAVLDAVDYTASSGTSIILASAASLNDEVGIFAFSTFDVANTYTQAQADAKFVELTGDTITGDLRLNNGNADGAQLQLASSGYSDWNLDNYSGRLRAYYGSTEYFTINTSGNVGIGTSSPSAKLQVNASTATGTSGSDGIRVNAAGNVAINIGADSNTGYGWIQSANWGSGYINTVINPNGGNLLVGTTTVGGLKGLSVVPEGAGSNTCAELVFNASATSGNTAMQFRYNGSAVGQITYTNTTTSFTNLSDYRAKENILPMVGALDKVAQLKPVTYNWKVDGSSGQGFIAHELQEVVPDCVIGAKDAVDADGNPVYQGIDTSFLVATLTAAIQEQQALITSLTARIEALESK